MMGIYTHTFVTGYFVFAYLKLLCDLYTNKTTYHYIFSFSVFLKVNDFCELHLKYMRLGGKKAVWTYIQCYQSAEGTAGTSNRVHSGEHGDFKQRSSLGEQYISVSRWTAPWIFFSMQKWLLLFANAECGSPLCHLVVYSKCPRTRRNLQCALAATWHQELSSFPLAKLSR